MPRRPTDDADAILKRLSRFKQADGFAPPPPAALGEQMIDFFKQSVKKRQAKLAAIAEAWGRLVPEMLNEHCALESLHRGALTVIVDSASHLYELKQLLLAGLEQQLLLACRPAGLRKITLRPGRWYAGGDGEDRRVQFERRKA